SAIRRARPSRCSKRICEVGAHGVRPPNVDHFFREYAISIVLVTRPSGPGPHISMVWWSASVKTTFSVIVAGFPVIGSSIVDVNSYVLPLLPLPLDTITAVDMLSIH